MRETSASARSTSAFDSVATVGAGVSAGRAWGQIHSSAGSTKAITRGALAEDLRIYCYCSTLGAGGLSIVLTSRHTSLQPIPVRLPDIANWQIAGQAADSKKAINLRILDLREVTSFTDFFLICSATNPRQGQAIADEVGRQLSESGELPVSMEGYSSAEWILMDYGDFIVHIFSENARQYYDLERLWRHAKDVDCGAWLKQGNC